MTVLTSRIVAIVKPTHECNLACKYCYIDENAEHGQMSSKTLENAIENLSSIPGIKEINFN